MHTSVGIILKNNKKEILMLDRANFPFGWACPAGHVDKGEEPHEAMIREAKEETGIDIKNYKLLFHKFVEWNECADGERGHDWHVFEATNWQGEPKSNHREAKKISWVASKDLKTLKLEPIWEYWFKKLKMIS